MLYIDQENNGEKVIADVILSSELSYNSMGYGGHDHLSHLNILRLIYKNPMKRYKTVLETQIINWDSFKFKVESLDEANVNMINLLFDIVSNSDLKSFCLKYFKDQRGCCGRSHLWLHKELRWESI